MTNNDDGKRALNMSVSQCLTKTDNYMYIRKYISRFTQHQFDIARNVHSQHSHVAVKIFPTALSDNHCPFIVFIQ